MCDVNRRSAAPQMRERREASQAREELAEANERADMLDAARERWKVEASKARAEVEKLNEQLGEMQASLREAAICQREAEQFGGELRIALEHARRLINEGASTDAVWNVLTEALR